MNIEFQLCGLIISLIMLVLYVSKQTLKMYSEKIFLRTLLVNTAMLVMDIMSIVVIKYQDNLPAGVVAFVCKLYVAFLPFIACMALIYILYDIIGEREHKRISCALLGATGLESIVVLCSPIFIYSQDGISYTYGLCTTIVYLCVAIYLMAVLFVAFYKKKAIYPRRWFAFMLWICIWILAGIIQFLFPERLVVGFASSLGMLILYIMLENPESNINRRLGCFNSYALGNYLGELFQKEDAFYVVFFYHENGGKMEEELVQEMLVCAKRYKTACVFKELNMDFYIITKKEEEYNRILQWVQRQKDETDKFKNIVVLSLNNGLKVKSEKNVQLIFQYYLRHRQSTESNLGYELTTEEIDKFLLQGKMQKEIKRALAEDRVEVFLQPIYSTHTDSFVSAEALVRIRKKNGELIPPDLFIPAAEMTGSIVELGERVFEKTCRFIAEKKIWEQGVQYIEVNLSVLQCEQEQLSDSLSNIMEKYDVKPSWINLEITETATLSAKKKLLTNMERLLEKGCSFSLDDFGKGESNLMYIVEMPVSILKLDYDMTKAFFKIPKAKNVLQSVVSMAHNMGLMVVAEGIETEEELNAMREQGIDYIQGYYFSKPLPMNEFYDLILKSKKEGKGEPQG